MWKLSPTIVSRRFRNANISKEHGIARSEIRPCFHLERHSYRRAFDAARGTRFFGISASLRSMRSMFFDNGVKTRRIPLSEEDSIKWSNQSTAWQLFELAAVLFLSFDVIQNRRKREAPSTLRSVPNRLTVSVDGSSVDRHELTEQTLFPLISQDERSSREEAAGGADERKFLDIAHRRDRSIPRRERSDRRTGSDISTAIEEDF